MDSLVSTLAWVIAYHSTTGSSLLLRMTKLLIALAGTISLDSACIQSWAVCSQVEPPCSCCPPQHSNLH